MTKNLNNPEPNTPANGTRSSTVGKLAPALFPLAVVAIGYLVGKQFFGF
ncbi:hypothetical protein [Mesorhizobium sp. LjNodule214]